MTIDQETFLTVPLNSYEKNPCSPSVQNLSWRGILIQAPQQVHFKPGKTVGMYGAFAAIPICGFYLFDISKSPYQAPMCLYAIDKKHDKRYWGNVVELNTSSREPDPEEAPIPDSALEGKAVGGYFNPNLADFVKLPEEPALYDVYVEYMGYKSNIVPIEIMKGK